MRIRVKEALYENHTQASQVADVWLLDTKISRLQYLSRVVNCECAIDGLFIWLAAWSYQQHLNVFHAARVWTSRAMDDPIFTDPALIFIIRCFLVSPAMHLEHNSSSNSKYI